MRVTDSIRILASALFVAGLCATTVTAEQPAAVPATMPPTVIPKIPVTKGRPHGQSYDPHVELDPETQIQIALRHKSEGRPQETLHTLSMAIDRYPQHARLYAVRGSLLLEEGRVALALTDLEKAIRLDPKDAEAFTNRAQAYRQFGRVNQAFADLNQAIALAPDLLAARFNRGAMRFGNRDLTGALEDFDHCIALDPHLPGPYFNRATVQDALGNKDAAVADLERFLQISQNPSWNSQAEEMLEAIKNPESVPIKPSPNPHE